MNQLQYIDVTRLKFLEDNPRSLNKRKFSTLKANLKALPSMLEIRPIIASNELIVYGGNMRLRAAMAIGLKQVPVIIVNDWSLEDLERFKLLDNLHSGDWDYDLLANNYDANLLNEVGLDVWLGPDDYKPKIVKKKYIKISIQPENYSNFTELLDSVKDHTGIYDESELLTKALTNLLNHVNTSTY